MMDETMVTNNQVDFIDYTATVKKRRWYWIVKRTQDVVLSSLALIVLLPIMLLTALIIFIDDPHGSPIFTQIRCGKNGKAFKMYKFRSMYVDAEDRLEELLQYNEMDGPAFKIKDDPRITRVGKFIRATSIDELPQLINVINGTMSLVGPRPNLFREWENLDAKWKQRACVSPGLTCYWQITPHRNDMPFDEWMELDLKYIREQSFLVDWRIMFKTVGAVLRKQGE
jgi:lipopolysaccharide/colanic/teichoic acid biosynthesis glycosyltransferase